VIAAGPALAFGLDALSFAVSAVTLARLRTVPKAPAQAGAAAETDAVPQPARTLRAMLRSERILQVILVVNVAANIGMGGMSEVALPALAHGPLHAGASGYGIILAAFGGGALLGTIAALLVRGLGPAPFFLFAAATLAAAILAGLSQRAWRDFGTDPDTTTTARHVTLEGQAA
jgi:hypothetical protein